VAGLDVWACGKAAMDAESATKKKLQRGSIPYPYGAETLTQQI
jgi:hypothetical protein